MQNFDDALTAFLAAAQAKIDVQYADSKRLGACVPVLTATRGGRYVRIVSNLMAADGAIVGQSAFAFVDATNGDILKAAGWKAPAKGARGSIFADDCGASAVTPYGAVYRR